MNETLSIKFVINEIKLSAKQIFPKHGYITFEVKQSPDTRMTYFMSKIHNDFAFIQKEIVPEYLIEIEKEISSQLRNFLNI